MTNRISLALVLHNHQPVGNFGWVIAQAFDRAYLPMVDALERHPTIRAGLHYSGPLLEWLRIEQPAFLDRLAALVGRDQVELLGGGYYEPVLASLPERDRLTQLTRMSDELVRISGRHPAGAWLAERVWEPDVATSLVDAGYRWTVLDDAHFRAAAVDDSALWGAYTTEDQGRLLTLFASDKELRYGIPFGRVEDLVEHLVANATAEADRVAMMGDDGEKFGAWPDTYEHCWGPNGWVDRFFDAVEGQADTITTVTPSDWLDRHPPVGRVYVPTSSYFEMGEWALPADQGLEFEETLNAGLAAGAPWVRWLRGGFWRNFQVKYREINELHKQMLRASGRVAAMETGPARDLALDHLHQGQSNDCYWHGVFGGIYISHMRLATHEHLIAAEDLADWAARDAGQPVDGIRAVDTDLDGRDELLAVSPGLVVVIDPAEGGAISSIDVRAVRHALTSVLRRRPEAYHARLLAHEATSEPNADGGEKRAAATIHSAFRRGDPGLAEQLVYDDYERRSGLVHLFAPGASLEAFAASGIDEQTDARDGAYEIVERTQDAVRLVRDVAWPTEGGSTIHIEKRFVIAPDRRKPGLILRVLVENRSPERTRFDLGVEWAMTMLGGGGNPDAYYRVDGESYGHDSSGRRDKVAEIASGNRAVGLELATTFEPAAHVWWTPIETISNSEHGFERVYQGSALLGLWATDLAPGESRTVAVSHAALTQFDRTEQELAAREGRLVLENPSARGLRTTG